MRESALSPAEREVFMSPNAPYYHRVIASQRQTMCVLGEVAGPSRGYSKQVCGAVEDP